MAGIKLLAGLTAKKLETLLNIGCEFDRNGFEKAGNVRTHSPHYTHSLPTVQLEVLVHFIEVIDGLLRTGLPKLAPPPCG
jgi:hypothetical protein